MGKKQQVLSELFRICKKRRNYVFDNDLVEAICKDVGFKNKFDITKLDSERLLPQEIREQDYAVMHLGK